MNKHEHLKIMLDDHLNINFAADLLTHFDLKRQLLYSTNNITPTSNNHDLLVINRKHDDDLCGLETALEKKNYSNHQNINSSNIGYDGERIYNTTHEGTPPPPPPPPPPTSSSSSSSSPSSPSICAQSHTERISEDDHAAESEDAEVTQIKSPDALFQTQPSHPPKVLSNLQLPTAHHHSLLRRSSAYLNQKFRADGMNALPLPSSTTLTKENPFSTEKKTIRSATMRNNDLQTVESNISSSLSATPSPPAFNALGFPGHYPPTPLHYSPVDPPSDRHRASFPWRKKSSTKDSQRRQSEPILSKHRTKGRRSFFF